MRKILCVLASICFGVLPFASAADLNAQKPPTITLDREVHFTSDEGVDIAVAPDSYAIGPGSEFDRPSSCAREWTRSHCRPR